MPIKDKNGYWIDSRGKAIPPQFIDPVKKKQDLITGQIIKATVRLHNQMVKHKSFVVRKIQELNEFSIKKNGTPAVTEAGFLTMMNFRGTQKIEVSSNDILSFDSVMLNSARQKFSVCIDAWASKAPAELAMLINGAFELDKKGRLNKGKVLSLLTYNIKDATWKDAQDSLRRAIQIDVTKQYENFLTREPGKDWQHINLYYAKIDPEGKDE